MNRNKPKFAALSAAIMMGAGVCGSPPVWAVSFELEEVVISARRQAESLQDAGIAIDAVTGDALKERGIINAAELAKAVPSLSLTNGGANITSIYMRGVGNNTVQSYQDPAVIPNYDGVSMGRGSGALGASFYDLERVEVLKGPQGILYGRNSTGGNINVIPAKPVIGETSGGVTIGVGNVSAREFDGYFNLGLSDNSAARFAAQRQKRDGIYNDGTGDRDITSLRGQYLIEASDDLSIRVGADYTEIGGFGPGGTVIGTEAGDPANLINTDWTFTPTGFSTNEGMGSAATDAIRVAQGNFPVLRDSGQNSEYMGVNVEVNWETDLGTVTFIPAYRKAEDASYFYGDAKNVGYVDEEIDQTSLELRLAGEAGMFEYVVGAIWFDEEVEAANAYNNANGAQLPLVSYDAANESKALFGQLTANVSDSLRLIGGLRYTKDDKTLNGRTNVFVGAGLLTEALPAFPDADPRDPGTVINHLLDAGVIASTATQFFPGGPLTGQNIDLDAVNQGNQFIPLANGFGSLIYIPSAESEAIGFSDVTWRAAVEYDIADDNMIYASVEEGYRAGGVQSAGGFLSSFDPEYVTAYTLGSKNRFMDDSLQLNIEAFFWEYEDQQVTYAPIDPVSGISRNGAINAGDADIQGFDVDLIARLAENTTLGAKVQYLDTEYTNASYFTAYNSNNYGCPGTDTGAVVAAGGSAGNPIVEYDCSGRPLLFSPEWTFNFDVEQVFPLENGMELVANVNASYRDDQYGIQTYAEEYSLIPSYWLVDASLTLNNFDSNWSVTGYVRNLGDTRRNLFPQTSGTYVVAHWNDPRTYGLTLSMEF